MSAGKKSNGSTEQLRALKNENVALKRQVQQLEAERDEYRRMIHAWAKKRISAATLLEWDRADEDSGQTPMDVVREVKRQRQGT